MKAFIERHEARLSHIFAPCELAYSQGKKTPYPHLAVRFAAKEAFFKALGTGWSLGLRWPEVAVESSSSGQPQIVLSGKAQLLAENLRVFEIHVSLSHTRDLATAQVVLESQLPRPMTQKHPVATADGIVYSAAE